MAGTLLNIKPILGIEDGEVVPLKRVRGAHKAFLEFVRGVRGGSSRPAVAAASGSRTRTRRTASSAARARPPDAPAGADRGRDHARRGRRDARRAGLRSASSGSTTDRLRSRILGPMTRRRALPAWTGPRPGRACAGAAGRSAWRRPLDSLPGVGPKIAAPPAQARPRDRPRPARAPAARLPARGRREPDRRPVRRAGGGDRRRGAERLAAPDARPADRAEGDRRGRERLDPGGLVQPGLARRTSSCPGRVVRLRGQLRRNEFAVSRTT